MGGMKDVMSNMESLQAQAREVALRAGAISTCPIHDSITIDQMDSTTLQDAYRIGAAQVRDGKVEVDHKDYMAAIKKVVDESAMDCPICADHAEED